MAGHAYAPDAELGSADIAAIEAVAREYWDSYYRSDGEGFEAIVHPDFELRGLTHRFLDTRADYVAVDVISRAEVAYLCGLGLGVSDAEQPRNEVTLLAATHYVASVKAVGRGQTHFLHLMRLPEGWKIVGAVYAVDGGVIPNQTFDS